MLTLEKYLHYAFKLVVYGSVLILAVSVMSGLDNKVSVTLEDEIVNYKQQAAALHVLQSEDRKVVLEDLDSDLVGDGTTCQLNQPGFPDHFVLLSTEADSKCPMSFTDYRVDHYYLSDRNLGPKDNPSGRIQMFRVTSPP